MARRLRQVIDLYTTGKAYRLKDGEPVWVRPLNPFEQDTARNEAQIAKARITLALKTLGSDELAKVRMFFEEDGIDAARHKIVDAKVAESLPRLVESMENDPEWEERISILRRGGEDTATSVEPIELELLTNLADEYSTELGKRLESERDFQTENFLAADEEDLWAAYQEWYLTRRSSELQFAEFRLHQILFGVRVCYGVETDAVWDHSECGSHDEQLFQTKQEVREAPEDLIDTLFSFADDLELTVREAKNSHRQGSSSDSSPLPSEAAESTASTPTGTRPAPPGSSL